MDLISGLPKFILYKILSRLPSEDAARTSVLSKSWRDTWYTFPIFAFCDAQIVGRYRLPEEDFLMKRDIFVEYMRKTLIKKRDLFRDQGLAMKEFKLIMESFDHRYMAKHTDLWITLAMESGTEFLKLCLPGDFEPHREIVDLGYKLPPGVLEAKSLNKLVLMGQVRVDQAILNHSIKFLSLRELSLWSVLVGDKEAFEHLISHCPLIEKITVRLCYVYDPQWEGGGLPLAEPRITTLKSLTLKGLQKLKVVDVLIQEVYIDALNLETLCYCPDVVHSNTFKHNFDNCRNLRQLSLAYYGDSDTYIGDKWFIDLFSKFPLLESLKMEHCSYSERINISSEQLKVLELELSTACVLKEIIIDAPKLLSCEYSSEDDDNPPISFLRHSSQLKVNVAINIHYAKLGNLREFIHNFKPLNVLAELSLLIIQLYTVEPNVHALPLPVLSPLPNIKHLQLLSVPEDESLHLLIVNNLLSSFCPQTISLCLCSYFCSREFIKIFYEMLTGRRQDECYCSSSDAKCWWHGLKNVKVTSSLKTDENADFETIFAALSPFAPRDYISFRLEV